MIKILITDMNNVEKNSFGIKIQREIESHNSLHLYSRYANMLFHEIFEFNQEIT